MLSSSLLLSSRSSFCLLTSSSSSTTGAFLRKTTRTFTAAAAAAATTGRQRGGTSTISTTSSSLSSPWGLSSSSRQQQYAQGKGRGYQQHQQSALKHTLILVRHGESTWNLENKFTGWYDCPLSDKGHEEVIEAGRLLAAETSIPKPDIAYTSLLQRAIRTLWHVLEETNLMWIPVHKAWQLNERHYGSLQGLDKQETVNKYGKEQVLIWRRSYDIPPPTVDMNSEHHPSNDPRYAGFQFDNEFTESLATTLDRVVPYYKSEIVPQLQANKTILIAAHGNSLRALVKHLDNIPEDIISELNIPTGVPLVYELDENNLQPIQQQNAISPLSGRYIGDQESIRQRIEGVKNQTK